MARQAGKAEKRPRLHFGSIKVRERIERKADGTKKTVKVVDAFYSDPYGRTTITKNGNVSPLRHYALENPFPSQNAAIKWLSGQEDLIKAGTWKPPKEQLAEKLAQAQGLPLFADYASQWIDQRKVKGKPLSDRTIDSYRDYLERFIAPTFGHLPLDEITPAAVNVWYDALNPVRPGRQGDTGESQRGKVYSFFRAVMTTAVSAHGPMPGGLNPVAVRGGGSGAGKRRDEHVVTQAEFNTMLDHMREDRRAMLLISLWCGLRYSEIAALTGADVDTEKAVIRVRKAVSRSRVGGVTTKEPKSEAGSADVAVPRHIVADLARHKTRFGVKPTGLMFPGANGHPLAPATFYGKATGNGWYGARHAAGRDDVTFHDLRGSGATLFSQLPGVNEQDVRRWLRDSTPQAAARYVRSAQSRRDQLADRMSDLAENGGW